MREKIEFCIRIILLAVAITFIVSDKGYIWPGVAMAVDPWRRILIKKIKENPSDSIIYGLIIETMATTVLYFKILMERTI
jgi:hypothetical protein